MLKNAPVRASLPAVDIERAKSFYAERLGLTPSTEDKGGLLYECGDGTGFVLFSSRGAASGQYTQATFQVADVTAEVVELKRRGVAFEEYDFPGLKTVDSIANLPNGARSAWFKDSEGNMIAVVQRPT
ncbi:MAG: VOC family protein [Candidatus Dormibacter sp.]